MTSQRIRTLKPGNWHDEKVSRLSRDARLLRDVLVTYADDDGRWRHLPAAIIGFGYPEDEDLTVPLLRGWVDELVAAGLVLIYEQEGSRYGCFPRWHMHQNINRYSPSDLPSPGAPGVISRADAMRIKAREVTVAEVVAEQGGHPENPDEHSGDSGSLSTQSHVDEDARLARRRALPSLSLPTERQDEPQPGVAREAVVAELDEARNRIRVANPRKVTYHGKRVDPEVVTGAERLLAAFNEATGRALGAYTTDSKPSGALKQVIGAMLARPEVTVERWEAGVHRTIASPPSFVNGGSVQIGHVFGEKAAEWTLTEPRGGRSAADAGDKLIAQALGKAS